MVESPYTIRPDARRWGFIRALPSNILALVLKLYRAVVSPLYGPVCRFFPSCSAYALEAVYVHGAFKGTIMSARRVVRCHPWQSGGVDPVPPGKRIWPKGQIPRIIELNHPPIPPDPLDESRRG